MSGTPYIKAGCQCRRCDALRNRRPWHRVIGRVAAITLVCVVYLLIIWAVLANAWTYWSGIITKENQVRKLDEIEQPTSCLNKAAPEEPIFVLRAKDPEAPDTVRTWANNARTRGTHEPEKIAEAFALAEQMDEYRRRVHPAPAKTAEGA